MFKYNLTPGEEGGSLASVGKVKERGGGVSKLPKKCKVIFEQSLTSLFHSTTECPAGKYGKNCAHRCSVHCSGPLHACDHVNGSCDKGCLPGYVAPLCINGNRPFFSSFFSSSFSVVIFLMREA